MDSIALFIGYFLLSLGGIIIIFGTIYWLMSLPYFKPKVIKILRLGMKEYLKRNKDRSSDE